MEKIMPMAKEPREIGIITMEINHLHNQMQMIVLGHAIEIGRRLVEAKAQLPHGAWGGWMAENLNFSKSTATGYMRVFEEYGSEQMGLFGMEAKSQTLGNLPYTKALALLAIPEDEREDFVEVNRVEDMSSRELAKAIAEKKAAEERAAGLESKLADMARQVDVTEVAAMNKLAESQQIAENLEKELQQARHDKQVAAETAKNHGEKAAAQLKKAEREKEKLQNQLKELQSSTNAVPKDAMEKIRQEAEAQNELKLKEKMKQAEEKVEFAKQAAKQAEKRADELEVKLALSNGDVTKFQVYFKGWQEQFQKMSEILDIIEQRDDGTVEKLWRAVDQALEVMGGG